MTLSRLDVRNPEAKEAALSAERVAIDFDWGSVFEPKAAWVGGEAVTLHVDLSGDRPLLGDLDATIKRFTAGADESGKLPRLNLENVRVVGDTPVGTVEATGRIVALSAEDFTIELNAPEARLKLPGAEVDLSAGQITARAVGGDITARLDLELRRFETGESSLKDVSIDLSIDQAAGVLTGKGAASAREIALKETHVVGAEARADLESSAVDLEAFSLERWLPGVRRLDLTASTGEGSIAGVTWKKGAAKALLAPREGGGSEGDASFVADAISLKDGSADKLEIGVAIKLAGEKDAATQPLSANGVARLRGASLAYGARRNVSQAVSGPLEAVLPTYAAATNSAISRAGERFELVLPVAIAIADDGYSLAALTGTEFHAASGLSLVFDGQGREQVASWRSKGQAQNWSAAGSLRLAGGGAPNLSLNIESAAGDAVRLAASGSADLRGWRVGDDMLAAQANGLSLVYGETGGRAAGQMSVQLTGGLGGGAWTRARATGGVTAEWTPRSFSAEAPNGLSIGWDEARYGQTVIGASEIRYTPAGHLAESVAADAILGSGTIAGFTVPIKGENFTATAKLSPTAVTWATAGALKISFDAEPAEVTLIRADGSIPIRIEDIVGLVEVSDSWRVSGSFGGGSVKADQAEVASLAAGFDLSGARDVLNGKLTDVKLRISDPFPEATRRFEAANFEGGAQLADGIASFSGAFTLAQSGVSIANVSGTHSLKSGSGSLAFAPTPLIFRPRSFEPKALSPFLRGPANVTGRVDISGGASWDANTFKTGAILELRNVGFAIASAGVFEGVSGKVVVDDLLTMKSAPGQTLTLDKVTLGLPIEKGVIKFQLIGFDAIRLEGAEWPFVGGKIRIRPVDFVFAAEENRIIAQAVDWDLAALIEQFKIDDLKVNGVVSGDFPVVFSTGSAKVDNAQLAASSKGGVIQYVGSTGDAAAQADTNAKMLFDALKDFRYQVMKLGLDGDLADRMVLKVNLLGSNPAVLNGKAFDLNISVDAPLVDLVSSFNRQVGDFIGLNVTKPEIELDSKALPDRAAPDGARN